MFCSGLGWAGLGWAGLGWAGLLVQDARTTYRMHVCTESFDRKFFFGTFDLGWAGLGWAGLGWAGLGYWFRTHVLHIVCMYVHTLGGETLNVTHPGAYLFHVSLACFHACCSRF